MKTKTREEKLEIFARAGMLLRKEAQKDMDRR